MTKPVGSGRVKSLYSRSAKYPAKAGARRNTHHGADTRAASLVAESLVRGIRVEFYHPKLGCPVSEGTGCDRAGA
jgi:hypothetical protein